MADIRCSHCGNDNPDFFDVCQFCQSPLKSESMLHTGEIPSQKDTGDLEPILPEWLQDARQQSRESGEEDTFSPETKPRIPSVERVDLLAGLASQDDEDDDEVPDWLASINPVEDKKSILSATSDEKKEEKPSDFFAQFSQAESPPPTPPTNEPASDDEAVSMGGMESQEPGRVDELADWLSQTSVESNEPISSDAGTSFGEENSWMDNLSGAKATETEPPSENEPEDLSWLHDLENASKQSGGTSSQEDAGLDAAMAQPESLGDDLSWLNNLGVTPASSAEEPSQPESSQDDLSWLKNLGGTPVSIPEEPNPSLPKSSEEDLNWLNNLGDITAPATEEQPSTQPESAQEDLDWMKNLGEEQSSKSEETQSVQFTPAGTAPLDENAGRDSTPDWLKSAMQEPLMPAPGELSMDWFKDHEKSTEPGPKPASQEMPDFQTDESDASIQDEPVSVSPGLTLPSSDSSTTSSQDVDAMFNIDIPDWISQESSSAETSQSESAGSPALADESLAPVDLPSWVQAMRPVDSAIAGTSSFDDADQEPESEGPLAGFRGVIPSAPVGSSLRPKAFSMKLQVTDEQQAGASLIEQIIASETAAHPAQPSTSAASQQMLRWILSSLFVVVIGLVIGLGWQSFDIVAPGQVSQLSNLVGTIPDGSPVLFVVGYEPAFAGELAAAAGPVLDQLALSRHSTFTFLSMSANGAAMVEPLLFSTKISRPVPEGLGYQTGVHYFNAGFLPGGSAGVLGFVHDPVKMVPDILSLANIQTFSSFEAVVLLSDNADSGRVWVEQLEFAKQTHPEIASKPLIVVSSAQAGPMLEPYVSSGQVDVLISGLSDAAKYEYVNQSRPGIARAYWDAFGVGLMIAVLSIVLGSIWNIFTGIRERRTEEYRA